MIRVCGIKEAGPSDITFFANKKYAAALRETRAGAVILGEEADAAPCPMLRTKNPYLAFARAVALFADGWKPAPGIHPLASVSESAQIAADAGVAPFVVVGDGARVGARTLLLPHVVIGREAQVGEDCFIHAGVSLRERVVIGNRVVIQDGAVIGSDGYGFARDPDGSHHKIPQVGGVVIEDDVEIGANTTIDRPAVGETRVGAGTKIDNLVQIAHGVLVGKRALLAAQVGIAGSTTLEDGVIMAGQSGATGHVRLGAGAIVSAKSAVTKDVAPGQQVAGVPAGDIAEWREASVLVRRLPELRKALSELESRLAGIEAALKPQGPR